jgi:phosphoserine phosphatase
VIRTRSGRDPGTRTEVEDRSANVRYGRLTAASTTAAWVAMLLGRSTTELRRIGREHLGSVHVLDRIRLPLGP